MEVLKLYAKNPVRGSFVSLPCKNMEDAEEKRRYFSSRGYICEVRFNGELVN